MGSVICIFTTHECVSEDFSSACIPHWKPEWYRKSRLHLSQWNRVLSPFSVPVSIEAWQS